MSKHVPLLAALLGLVLGGCSAPTRDAGAQSTAIPAASIAWTASPLGRLVEPPPTSCSSGPTPQAISRDFGPALGQSPVWAVTFGAGPRGAVLLLEGSTELGPHGLYRKVLWVIQPGYSSKVHITGTDVSSGALLWFEIANAGPTTDAVLDPTHPGAYPVDPANPDAIFAEFPSYLFVPRSGCYVLEATWAEGRWRIPFAAGGVVAPKGPGH